MTHSAQSWSYQKPAGLACPVETIRSTLAPGQSARIVVCSASNCAGRSAKRLPPRIMGLAPGSGSHGHAGDRDPDRGLLVAMGDRLAVETGDGDGGADHSVQPVLISLEAPTAHLGIRPRQPLRDAANAPLERPDDARPDGAEIEVALVERER